MMRFYDLFIKVLIKAWLNLPPIRKIIEENPVAFATVDQDNKPNVICVACVKTVSQNQILITDNYMKATKENLSKNDNICLAVWDKEENGYKLAGKAEYFIKGKWKKFAEKMPENKRLPAKGAVLITVSKLIKLLG